MKRDFVFGIGAALALLFAPPVASAQGLAAADALFQEGQAALARGELQIACAKLKESDRIDPANGTKLNLADCEEKRGHIASAWELYRRLNETLPAGDQRLPYVKARMEALDARVPRLTLLLAPESPQETQARLGSLVLMSASFGTALPVEPGNQVLVVAAGSQKRSYRLNLHEGEHQTLQVSPASDVVARVADRPSDTDKASRNGLLLGYTLGGMGAAGLAVGTIAGVVGLQKQGIGNDNCSDKTRTCNQAGFDANESARSMRTISSVGFVVGLLGVGAGAYFLLTNRSDDKLALGARINGETASLALDARW